MTTLQDPDIDRTFRAFADTIQTVLSSFTEVAVDNNRYFTAQLASLFPGIPRFDDESDDDYRAAVTAALCGNLLGGSVSAWMARRDVVRVLRKKDGSIVVFARSFPRLTRDEVTALRQDLTWYLPATSSVRLIALWK